jgi:hypothetical protein
VILNTEADPADADHATPGDVPWSLCSSGPPGRGSQQTLIIPRPLVAAEHREWHYAPVRHG